MSNDNRDRIPSEELTAYERWELPLLDRDGNEVAHSRSEERDVKPLTAADIEAIREAAWEDGKAEGRETGNREGYEAGFETGRSDGYEKGHAEGTEKGQNEGNEAAQNDVKTGLDRLEQVMAELVDPIQRHEDELETALFNLTATLSRAVIFRELQADSSQIREVVRHAMASLPPTRDNVRIRVNPVDVEWVQEVSGRFESEAIVTADEKILAGGCKVETRHSLIDYTVEKRFQKAVQGMLDKQLDSSHPRDGAGLDAIMDDLTVFHREVLEESHHEVLEESPSPETDKVGQPAGAASPAADSAPITSDDTPKEAPPGTTDASEDAGHESEHAADLEPAADLNKNTPEDHEEQDDEHTR